MFLLKVKNTTFAIINHNLIKLKGYAELKNALFSFRTVFKKGYLPANIIKDNAPLLKKLIDTDTINWSTSEAFDLYNILNKYSDKLRLVGYDFNKVPRVSIQQKYNAYNTDRVIGYDGTNFMIRTPYITNIVNFIKMIPGRSYNSTNRVWIIPLSEVMKIRELISKYNFTVGDKAQRMLINVRENLEQSYSAERVELNVDFTHKTHELFDFQTGGVDFAHKNKRIINGDQMGLGKTIQGLGGVLINDSFPNITICPKTLRKNWAKEWTEWTNKKVIILSHKNVKKIPALIEQGLVDVVITNYEGIRSFFVEEIREVLITKGSKEGSSYKKVYTNGLERLFKSAILDEAHNCRNSKTIRYKTIKKVFEDKEVRICLTGTPIVKSPNDLGALLEIIGRIEEFGGSFKFKKAFRGIGKEFINGGEKNLTPKLKALNIKLRSTCFIRREKYQVLKDLPDKYRKVINCEITNRREYDQAYISIQSWLSDQNYSMEKIDKALKAQFLVRLGVLKKLSSEGKIDEVVDFADNVINEGEKLIIFCWYNDTVERLKKAFPGAAQISGKIDGREMTDDEIEEAKKRFQEDDDCKVIIVTYKKGGEGHTLTAASKVAFIELGWTYKDQSQAEDRAHRISQKNNVGCYYFLGDNTVDEDIYNIIDARRRIEKESTGGSEEIATTFNDLAKKILKK